MVFRIKIISDKIEDFAMVIEADTQCTFFELHEVIQDECQFDPSQLATFYVADEEWDARLEIPMFDQESNQITMKNQTLGQHISNQEDRLIYVFDTYNIKSLFLEVMEVIPTKKINSPNVILKRGTPPTQSSVPYLVDPLPEEAEQEESSYNDFGELDDLNLIYGEIGEVI